MKAKHLTLPIAFLVVIAGLVLAWRVVREQAPLQMPPVQVPTLERTASEAIADAPPIRFTNHHDGEASILDEATRKRLEKMDEAGKARNVPISFHAKFEDQHAQPVEGVAVKVEVVAYSEGFVAQWINPSTRSRAADQRRDALNLLSDSNGLVSVTGKTGQLLTVRGVNKQGYLVGPIQPHTFGYDARTRRALPPRDNPANPIVYKLWLKGAAEPLVHLSLGKQLEGGNSTLLVNLIDPSRSGSTSEAGSADLKFKVTNKGLSQTYDRGWEWNLVIEAIDGGVMESSESLPYVAPKTGYRKEVRFESKGRNESDWNRGLDNTLIYCQARGGRVFASLRINLLTYHTGAALLELSGLVNPHGSRNLEPDPDKLITDPEEIRRLDLETSK